MQLKKLFLAAGLAAALTLSLSGCGGSGSTSSSSSGTSAGDAASSSGTASGSGTATASSSGFTFTYEDTTVVMGSEADPVIEALGDDYEYFESASCAFDGLDKVYTYSHFKLNTYPVDDVDYVLSIVFRDDTIETEEGITIGRSKDDVIEAYGEPDEEKTASLVYERDDTTITFGITGDAVSTVTIAAVTE
ncbi:MAG: hypothetical protein LUI87_05095 [Lachnospiraceae bacterium]|nr:hypothetical protein [Lachnospiraceae bacterium]